MSVGSRGDSHPDEASTRFVPKDDSAERGRRAERTIDLHLDLVPYVDLGVTFDHAACLREVMAISDRFVVYKSDPKYSVTHWRGIALQALDGDETHAATMPGDDYGNQARWMPTRAASDCPTVWALAQKLVDTTRTRNIAVLQLDPGSKIAVHRDGEGPYVMRSVNVALNMPEGCAWWNDVRPDGTHHAYSRRVPFVPGSTMLVNVGKQHYVDNQSTEPRLHLIMRGTLKIPALEILDRAARQNGLATEAEVVEKLVERYRALGEVVPEGSPLDLALRERAASA